HRVDAAVQHGRGGLGQRHGQRGEVLVRVEPSGLDEPAADEVAARVGAAEGHLAALEPGDGGDAGVDAGDHVLDVVVRAGEGPERLRAVVPRAGAGVRVV